jgi:undecaprenyl-diphosphatase
MILIVLDSIKAIILGIVEGFTEFLPISSTGHLILVNQFITFDKQFTLLFDIVIQLGAILAVVVFFWKRLWPFSKDKNNPSAPLWARNKEIWTIWFKTIIGVLPAIIFGALFASKIEEKLFNPWVVVIALILGGIIILFIENRKKEAKINSIKDLSYKTAFLIGLVQCLSMIPGTSRSASTIIGAMIFGASRVVATEFSFFLAIPTMVDASAYSLFKYRALLHASQLFVLSIGFIVSFIVALAVIKFLIDYVKKNDFKIFGYYRIVLGIAVIAYFLIK